MKARSLVLGNGGYEKGMGGKLSFITTIRGI